MFCKECGTENLENESNCKNCNNILTTNLPLNGGDRTKIIAFFTIMILPFAWLGFSLVILLITIFSLYIMKKDKSFTPILNAQKYIKKYIIFGVIIALIAIFSGMIYNTFFYYDEKNFNGDSIALLISLIAPPIAGSLFMFICNNLFFKPLEEHKDWIIKNGIFADSKDKESIIDKVSEKIQVIKKEPLNNIDELLKWAELKEKGLITEEEFKKAKEKILEGKL